MKYTRYNAKPKKKNGNNLLFYFALTLLLALVLGTFVQKYFFQEGKGISFKDQGQQNQGQVETITGDNGNTGEETETKDPKEPITDNDGNNQGGEVVEKQYYFYLVQCGVFKVRENADKLLETLKPYGRPFVEMDGDVTKVYFGIYSEVNVKEVQDLLATKGIETSKVEINVAVDDLSTGQLCKISENMIEIMNKTYEPGVKSIDTADIKGWVGQLEPINGEMKQYEAVEELKSYINGLPDEVSKNEIQDGMELIYSKLKMYR